MEVRSTGKRYTDKVDQVCRDMGVTTEHFTGELNVTLNTFVLNIASHVEKGV